jgi:hypothetical protein
MVDLTGTNNLNTYWSPFKGSGLFLYGTTKSKVPKTKLFGGVFDIERLLEILRILKGRLQHFQMANL